MRPESGLFQISHKSKNWKWRHKLLTWRRRYYFILFCFILFLTFPCFSCQVWLCLAKFYVRVITYSGELWHFLYIWDWPEIRNWEIPPSVLCPIFGEWGKLVIQNLAGVSIIKYCLMLQNARFTAFTVSKWLMETNSWGKNTPLPPRLCLTKLQ